MPVVVCPRAETLAAFARGDLSLTELSAVADHIGTCTTCSAALKFVPEDSLAGLARAAAASPVTVKALTGASPLTESAPVGHTPAGFTDHPRYRIISELGAGGMGTVYKAEDLLMGRVIALKVVSAHLTAKASAVAWFQKEIRAAAQLNHPSVITAHDTGEAGGLHFLVMEFVEGVSLDRLVTKKGPLPVPMACAFTRHAALGLQHAADKGMVHRDIKPQNLMVTRKGQVKILDFGLARFARTKVEDDDVQPTTKLPFGAGKTPTQAGVTNPNMLMGTPDYLSPEQAKDSHAVDHRSDIYSLGCTLYFLLTGKAPFLDATTLIDKLLAHTNDEPPAVYDARPETPAGLADVLAKMMAKKPADRYQTAAEAASALLPFTRSDSSKEPVFEIVDAVVITPVTRAGSLTQTPAPGKPLAFDTTPAAPGPTMVETTRKPRRVKKRKKASWRKQRNRAIIGGAVAAMFLAVAVVISIRGQKPDAPTDPITSAKANTQSNPPQGKTDKNNAEKGTKGIKSEPVPPTVIAPPIANRVQILYVLPSNGVWLDDFLPVRDHFVAKGAKVITTSSDGDRSWPSPQSPGRPVPIDVRLRADMNLSDYDAVAFCGENVSEYMFAGRGSNAAAKVIQRMQTAGKPVAATGVGQGVLVFHGVLKGKKAAPNRYLFDKHPFMTGEKSGITWDKPGVTLDGKIVTASGPPDAIAFADMLLKAIEEK